MKGIFLLLFCSSAFPTNFSWSREQRLAQVVLAARLRPLGLPLVSPNQQPALCINSFNEIIENENNHGKPTGIQKKTQNLPHLITKGKEWCIKVSALYVLFSTTMHKFPIATCLCVIITWRHICSLTFWYNKCGLYKYIILKTTQYFAVRNNLLNPFHTAANSNFHLFVNKYQC